MMLEYGKKDDSHNGKDDGRPAKDMMTVSSFLSVISKTEYPKYITDAIGRIQNWMLETANAPAERGMDSVTAMFEDGSEMDMDKLFTSLETLEQYIDVIPNVKRPEGREDAIIVSVNLPEYESGIRTAIDYAALFNRQRCKRVWVLSDSFVFVDVMRYAAHIDALIEQGIVLRFIMIAPWGWVEVPLNGKMASTQQYVWHSTLGEGNKNS